MVVGDQVEAAVGQSKRRYLRGLSRFCDGLWGAEVKGREASTGISKF